MGNAQSSLHSSHFPRPETEVTSQQSSVAKPAPAPPPPQDVIEIEEDEEPKLINISNKMVERLVEEQNMFKEVKKPRKEKIHHDKMYIERLRCIDERHSEEIGLMIEDIDAMAGRINARAAKISSVEPICGDCEAELISCYGKNDDKSTCNPEVERFKRCVKEHTAQKLHERILDIEGEELRKSRELEEARKRNFWGNLEPQKVT